MSIGHEHPRTGNRNELDADARLRWATHPALGRRAPDTLARERIQASNFANQHGTVHVARWYRCGVGPRDKKAVRV